MGIQVKSRSWQEHGGKPEENFTNIHGPGNAHGGQQKPFQLY